LCVWLKKNHDTTRLTGERWAERWAVMEACAWREPWPGGSSSTTAHSGSWPPYRRTFLPTRPTTSTSRMPRLLPPHFLLTNGR
jgi:hypothetical protein